MAPLLFKHLATALSHHVVQISRLHLTFSTTAARAYRSLYTLSSAPQALLLSSARITSTQPLPSVSSAQCGPSLLGQCQHLACIQPSVGMKTKSALRRRCKDCFFVRRRGRLFVFCKAHPRHKQRQG